MIWNLQAFYVALTVTFGILSLFMFCVTVATFTLVDAIDLKKWYVWIPLSVLGLFLVLGSYFCVLATKVI